MKKFQKGKGGRKGKGTTVSASSSAKAEPLQDKAIGYIKGGNTEALAKMCEEGSDEIKFLNKFHSKNGKTSICVAAEEGRIEAVEILLDAKAAVDLVDKTGMTAILYAAAAGEKEIVELLHEAQADMLVKSRAKQENALMLAVSRNHLPVVTLLSGYGIFPINDVNNAEESALAMAVKFEYYAVAEFLLQQGAEVNMPGANGNTPLIRTAFDGRVKTTSYVLEHGGDVNVRNVNGETALMVATRHGHSDIVDVLLQKGAEVNARDSSGRTALMVACMTGRFDMAEQILNNNTADSSSNSTADPNICDSWGYTALLHVCAGRSSVQSDPEGVRRTLDLLLEKGAYVDCMDRNYMTALMHCCLHAHEGHLYVAQLLVERGAVSSYMDMHGRPALDLIRDDAHKRIFQQMVAALPVLTEEEQYSRPGVRRKPEWMDQLNEESKRKQLLEEQKLQEECQLTEQEHKSQLQKLQQDLQAGDSSSSSSSSRAMDSVEGDIAGLLQAPTAAEGSQQGSTAVT